MEPGQESRRTRLSRPGAKRLIAAVAAGIFLGELLIMSLVTRLDGQLSTEAQTLIDALCLLAVTLPLLYFLFYRPLLDHILAHERLEADLEKLATRDPLTDVANRRFGLAWLESQLKLSSRKGTSLCVCFVDIDGLKAINDRHGHLAGDAAIRLTSLAMAQAVRESDLVTRFGGDEFLIIMPDCTLGQAEVIWQRLEAVLRAETAATADPYRIRLSHGIVESKPLRPLGVTELLQLADQRMYFDKKRRGKEPAPRQPLGFA